MKDIEKVFLGQKLVAIVIRKKVKVDILSFFTTPASPLQVGIHNKTIKTLGRLHFHKLKSKITISQIYEFFFVQEGKIKIAITTKKSKLISTKFLGTGDAILLMGIAHKVDFLRPSRVLEVKQGPYNKEQTKIYNDI